MQTQQKVRRHLDQDWLADLLCPGGGEHDDGSGGEYDYGGGEHDDGSGGEYDYGGGEHDVDLGGEHDDDVGGEHDDGDVGGDSLI